jgi:hypothetical protein
LTYDSLYAILATMKHTVDIEIKKESIRPHAAPYVTLLDTIESQHLHQLEEAYALRDPATVQRFLRTCPQLIEVLLEAHVYLQKHFGPDPQVTLEVVSDPEAESMDELFAYIITSLPVDEALARLDMLDEEWFLDQLDRVNGQLNFNLEFA